MGNSGVPLYKKIVDFYTKKILCQELAPDVRMDSIVRIMSRHKVSRDTAKRVLKELSEGGYIRKIVGKGSFVTSSTEVKKIWGMVIPFYSSNIEELIRNLKMEAGKTGSELIYYLTYNNPDEEKRLVTEMILKGYEAVIVIPNYDETLTADYYRHLIPGNTTIVLVDNTMAGSYFKYVIQSYDLGVARAIEYLTAQNQGNLLLVKNEDWRGRNLLYELMDRTFCDIIQTQYSARNPFTINNAFDLTYEFLDQHKIGGIVCCTDTDSIRVLGRIKKWGVKIPSEISLVSYGNTELTEYFEPPITSLDCQYNEMANKTAELITKGKNCGLLEQHIVNPKIIVRGT
jgi:DNA-binding LacI/PurR family transcriptional regulator